jgi:EmrB/QacA subfamily drug resistance transporter
VASTTGGAGKTGHEVAAFVRQDGHRRHRNATMGTATEVHGMTSAQTIGTGAQPHNPLRWKALAVLALVQFMLILDITVVNVALPSIRRDLGFSQSGLAWVVNGYTLMAGGLLLLGGRLSDVLGRRRLFLIGVALFAVASLSCGLAVNPAMLVTSRFVQGAGEALAAPAALGLVALLFPVPKERVKALGIWGGIAGLGGTSGTVISGALTGLASWRWIFLVNLPVAAFALLAVPRLVQESRMDRSVSSARRRVDVWGPITATAGLVAIVDGLLQAATDSWGSVAVLLPLIAGIGLLGLFVSIEARVEQPLIPLRFFTNRTRVVTNFVTLFFASAFFSYFFLLTLFMQLVLHFKPLQAGLAYLPFGIGITLGIGIGTGLMPKLGAKPLLVVAFFGSAVGMLLTSGITPGSGYADGILPGMLVLAFFSGISFGAVGNAALHQVTAQDASLASGVQNAVQQVGGAIGLACLVTLALRHAGDQTQEGVAGAVAATNGYALALRIAAVLLAVGGILAAVLLERIQATASPAMADLPPTGEPLPAAAGVG